MDYLQKQQHLQHKAKEIFKDLNLINVLRKFGEVNIVGSYALGLMSWEDIDIVVNGQQNVDDFLVIVTHLFKQTNVYSLNIQDFRKSIFPQRPQGMYCGISYLVKPDIFWKIDIWFLAAEDKSALDLGHNVQSKLDDNKREIILTIKNEMREQGWGKLISGMDVYKAVLDNNVTNTEQFREYHLKKKSLSCP